MAIVSITEASRLTGKDRRTIQRHIAAGKLSKAQKGGGVDTSELIRVYGEFVAASDLAAIVDVVPQIVALENDIKFIELRGELEKALAIIKVQEKHIESLDNAMRLLEDQRQKITPAPQDEPKKEPPKGFIKRLFNM